MKNFDNSDDNDSERIYYNKRRKKNYRQISSYGHTV